MRFSTVGACVLATIPSIVSAQGTLGFALGDKLPAGTCKYTSDYEADFDAISSASSSKLVRIYAASDCNTAQQILPAAATKGFQVVLGVWPDTIASYNADVAALQTYVPGSEDQVYAITVGSETLYRGSFTGPTLLQKIKAVKAMFPSIKVGTADSWNKFADGTADAVIQGGVDILLTNAFGYWQGQNIGNATSTFVDDIMQAFGHVQNLAGSSPPELWVGETGWPTDGGSNYGSAIASTANALTFWTEGVCGIKAWGVNVFYFEAFDEPWKPASVGDDGVAEDETHWGAMTSTRAIKFPLTC